MAILSKLDLPPLWLALHLGLAWFMASVWAPLGGVGTIPGAALMLAGVGLILWAGATLHRAGTPIEPHQDPSALVTAGPFARSRNPIYVAFLMILAGWCVLLGTVAGLVLLAPLWVVLESRFVRPEEARLARHFGTAFEAYRQRVPRWIGSASAAPSRGS